MELLERLPYFLPWWIYFIVAGVYKWKRIPKYLRLHDQKLSKRNKDLLNYGLQQLLVILFYFISIRIFHPNDIGVLIYYGLIFLPFSILILLGSGYLIDRLVIKK